MKEEDTRAELIEPALRAAGWGVVEGSRIRREYTITPGRLEGYGRRAKPKFADFVLIYRNQKLAVVEAKSCRKYMSEGLTQAKEYARMMDIRFTYSTNGKGIYAVDMKTGKEGEIAAYPSPEELWKRTFAKQNEWRDLFADEPLNDMGRTLDDRYFRDLAIERVLDAIAKGKQRILLTLATGTGKTTIAAQIVWKLFKSRWNLTRQPTRQPRVLFLADRNLLADQAYSDFSFFADDALQRISPDEIRKKGKPPTNGHIFFTIFQTFLCGPPLTPSPSPGGRGEPTPYFGEYPPDFFDFIIIDECHRGGAKDESNWRCILEHFSPAVQLGLTATPKRKDNVDTYAYFGKPVFTYSLKQGINDGFLTPFRVKQIDSNLDEYVYASDDRVMEGEVTYGKVYKEAEFNRKIQIMERERQRVKEFMAMIDQKEQTLVFCATQVHALAVRDLINQMKTSSNPNYCVRVTADEGGTGEKYLREFRYNEKNAPTILTTSQKLSTGVDARNIRNIVLMRPVNSMIEFKQIIGRGTRLFEGKDYFTIYDFVKAYELFKDPEWDGPPLDPEPCKRCNCYPCQCQKQPPQPCKVCGMRPCECDKEPCPECGERPCACNKMVKIKLADGKERTIQHVVVTSYFGADNKPMTAVKFIEELYGKLPEFFKSEAELRRHWSHPKTRRDLLEGLAAKGFGKEQLAEMQKIIDAEKSDLFDVLAHVRFALPPLTREERVAKARALVTQHFNSKQQVFLKFVLSQYESVGVDVLAQEGLSPLLNLKYHDSINDAIADLGKPEAIRKVFTGFQKYLYVQKTA